MATAYDAAYRRARAALLAGRPWCVLCRRTLADSADHDPPLYLHRHVPGSGCCRLRPVCMPCNVEHSGGWRAVRRVVKARAAGVNLRARELPAPSRDW